MLGGRSGRWEAIDGAVLPDQAVRKLHGHLRAAKEAAVERTLPRVRPVEMAPHADDVDAELDEAAQVITALCLHSCSCAGCCLERGGQPGHGTRETGIVLREHC